VFGANGASSSFLAAEKVEVFRVLRNSANQTGVFVVSIEGWTRTPTRLVKTGLTVQY